MQVLLADIGYCGDLNTWRRRQFPDPAEESARLTCQACSLTAFDFAKAVRERQRPQTP